MHDAAYLIGVALFVGWLSYECGFRDANRSAAKRQSRLDRKLAVQLRRLGFASYGAYLKGRHWKAFRKAYLAQVTFVMCTACGLRNVRRLKLHHRSYDRLGHERYEDVVLLCGPCHSQTHRVARVCGSLPNAHRRVRTQRQFHGASYGPAGD